MKIYEDMIEGSREATRDQKQVMRQDCSDTAWCKPPRSRKITTNEYQRSETCYKHQCVGLSQGSSQNCRDFQKEERRVKLHGSNQE